MTSASGTAIVYWIIGTRVESQVVRECKTMLGIVPTTGHASGARKSMWPQTNAQLFETGFS
jgi:hypothetical protein